MLRINLYRCSINICTYANTYSYSHIYICICIYICLYRNAVDSVLIGDMDFDPAAGKTLHCAAFKWLGLISTVVGIGCLC